MPSTTTKKRVGGEGRRGQKPLTGDDERAERRKSGQGRPHRKPLIQGPLGAFAFLHVIILTQGQLLNIFLIPDLCSCGSVKEKNASDVPRLGLMRKAKAPRGP